MGQQREAVAMGWMARNTGPHAPPQRPGKSAAGACVSPCPGGGGWGSADVVLAPPWLLPRSAQPPGSVLPISSNPQPSTHQPSGRLGDLDIRPTRFSAATPDLMRQLHNEPITQCN